MIVDLKMIAAVRERAAAAKKEGYHSQLFYPKDVSDGETVELKFLPPVDGQMLLPTLLNVKFGVLKSGLSPNFTTRFSQNFPFSKDGECALIDAIHAIENDPEQRIAHATALSQVRQEYNFIQPVLVLDVKANDETGDVEAYAIRDNEVKFLVLTSRQVEEVTALMDSRDAKNDDGNVYSWAKGRNISLRRKGKEKDTKYTFGLVSKPLVIKEEAFKAPVDTYAYIKTQIQSDEKLLEVFVKYFG